MKSIFKGGAAAIAAAVVSALASSPARAQAVMIYNLGVLDTQDDSYNSFAYGVNVSGMAVGYSGSLGFVADGTAGDLPGMTNLGSLGGTTVTPYGINASGEIVGVSTTNGSSSSTHAFAYLNGTMSDLGTLGGTTSAARAINGAGQIVGFSLNSSKKQQAFVYNPGGPMTLLALPTGALTANAAAINGNGVVAGATTNSSSAGYATVWTNNVPTTLGALTSNTSSGTITTGTQSWALGINDAGAVVGQSTVNGTSGLRGFEYVNGKMWNLGSIMPNSSCSPYAINNSGWVVGNAAGMGSTHAFMYVGTPGVDGHMIDLNTWMHNADPSTSGWTISQANGISDNGYVVGQGTHAYYYADVDQTVYLTRAYVMDASAAATALNTWNLDADGSWGGYTNWYLGTTPNSIGVSATLGNYITAPRTISMGATNAMVGNLTISSAQKYTLTATGTGTFTFSKAGSAAATLNVTAGSHSITAPIAILSDLAVTVAPGSTLAAKTIDGSHAVSVTGGGTLSVSSRLDATNLTIDPGSKLDLLTGKIVLTAGSESAVGALIASGLLTSSSETPLTTLGVITNSNGLGGALYTSFASVTVAAGNVLVKYTYLGDTDLSGSVNALDLENLLAGMNGHLTGWVNGDTNYDGVVDGTDLANLMASLRGQGAALGEDGDTGGGGAVPEPGSLALAALALPLMRRPRR